MNLSYNGKTTNKKMLQGMEVCFKKKSKGGLEESIAIFNLISHTLNWGLPIN